MLFPAAAEAPLRTSPVDIGPPQADITAAAETGTDPRRQRNGQAPPQRGEARQNAKQGLKDQDAHKERRNEPALFAYQR